MKKILFLLFLFYTVHLHAQSLGIDSTRFVTGLRVGTSINYAIPTADKGILFVGYDYGNPGGIIPYFPLDTGVNGNVFIGKIDSNQQISWLKVYGGSDADGAISACQTADGGYAVLANTLSSNGDVTGFKGVTDIWLLRLDASGNMLWEKTYGSSAQDGGMSVAATPDHGFIIAGTSFGHDGDVPFHYGSTSLYDWLVIKTDSAGTVQWSKDLGGTGDEGYTGSILVIDSAYYLVSNSFSTDHDCTDTAWHSGVPTAADLYILKIDAAGNVLWDSSYGGTNTDGANFAMYDTRDSTIVISGFTGSNDYMVTGYQGNGDMWVLKVNKNGTLLWQKTLGSSYEDNCTGICAANNGRYLAYGNTHNGIIGLENLWLFVLDSAGNETYNKLFGGVYGVVETSCSILPYLNGYVATGLSGADSFTEGTTYGNFTDGGPFLSYIDTNFSSMVINIKNGLFSQINIWPNPCYDYLKVSFSDKTTYNIIVVNSIGQMVYKATINASTNNIIINTEGFTGGMYCIEWINEDGYVDTKKFIKN